MVEERPRQKADLLKTFPDECQAAAALKQVTKQSPVSMPVVFADKSPPQIRESGQLRTDS